MRLASLALVISIAALGQAAPRPVLTWPIAEEKPSYETPAAARDANLAGTVILYAEITSEGKPAKIAVIQSLGVDLDTAAMNALAKATFRPATEGGVPVRIAQSYDVSFLPVTPGDGGSGGRASKSSTNGVIRNCSCESPSSLITSRPNGPRVRRKAVRSRSYSI